MSPGVAVETHPLPGAPEAANPIAEERALPGRPGVGYVAAFASLCLLVGGGLVWQAVQNDDGSARLFGLGEMDNPGASVLAAVFTLAGIAATTWGARRLLHSDVLSLLVGALVALDPLVWALGPTASPMAALFGFTMTGFALMLSPSPRMAWVGGACLAIAAALHPGVLAWTPVFAALALFRGHIYAAPDHLGASLAKTVALPVFGALVGVAARSASGHDLVEPMKWITGSPWMGTAIMLDGRVGFGDPIVHFAGLVALAIFGFGGLVLMAGRFRLQRLPGRIQVRLPGPLPAVQGRMLWLLLFAAAVSHPILALPIVAMALVAGIGALGDDAPGFGLALGLAAMIFAGGYLWQSWDAATGGGLVEGQKFLDLVPWSKLVVG